MHFHLFDVQVINRVGWDGFIRLPDPNELGWKDTVRISGLEDTIVALRPVKPPAPWPLPNSVRPLNVNMPMGDTTGFSQTDIADGGPLTPPVVNQMVNFGWEYVWHCHILSHEENDMMRPMVLQVPPEAPANLVAVSGGGGVNLTWMDKAASETGFTLQRADDSAFTVNLATFDIPGTTPATLYNVSIPYADAGATGPQYYYRVQSYNTNVYNEYLPAGVQTATLVSPWSNIATLTPVPIASVLPTALAMGNQLVTFTSAPKSVTLTTAGTLPLIINSIGFTGANPGDFSQTSTCGGSLAPGASCTIDVTFTPTAINARAANLVISTNDPLYPLTTVALSGTGITRIAGLAPGFLTFASQMVNFTSPSQTVALSNTGNAPLAIISLTFGGTNPTDFIKTTTCGASLPAGATCTISVFFRPESCGSWSIVSIIVGLREISAASRRLRLSRFALSFDASALR